MKKLFAGIFATVLGLSCFSACNLLNNKNVTYDVEGAADLLDATYVDQIVDGREDYDLLNTISFNNASYSVEWSVEAESGVVLVKGEETTKVDVDQAATADVDYILTATVSDPNGNTATVKFYATLLKAKALIPVEITEKPVEGQKYKLYVYNNDAKKDCYFAGGIQSRFYLNSVEDYEDETCVDVYVEYVTDSDTLFNLYFNHKSDGKQYVGIKENWNSTKGYWAYNPVIAGEPVSQFEYSTEYKTIVTTVAACSVDEETAEQDTTKTIFWGNSGGTYTSIGGVDVSEIDDKSFTGYVANLVTMESAKDVPAKEKVAFEKDALQLKDTYTGAQEISVLTNGKRYPDVQIAWAVTGDNIAYADGKLTITAPTAETTVKATATFTLGETTDTKEFTITLKPALDLPAANSTLTIPEANALGAKFEKDTYSEDKYYVTGIVKSIVKEDYGNLYIQDEDGNEFYIYGLYDEAGARYDAMDPKPVVGDTITVWGRIGKYSSAQMKNATMTAYTAGNGTLPEGPSYTTPEEILNALYGLADGQSLSGEFTLTGKITAKDNYNNPTIVVEGFENKPVYCYKLKVDNAIGDTITVTAKSMKNYGGTYEFMDCTLVTDSQGGEGGNEGTEPETPALPEGAITVSIADYAAANNWANSTLYSELTNENFTVKLSVETFNEQYGQNTGKYYTGNSSWRVYQNEVPSIVITAAEGKSIVSVIITYAVKNTGVLVQGETQIESDAVVTVNAASITFSVGNTTDVTNGNIQITAISVVIDGEVTPPAGGEDGGEVTPPEGGEDGGETTEIQTLTIPEANALASTKAHDTYTEEKYYVSGIVSSIYNTTYGNMYIVDENNNTLNVYGTYDADGSNRFDAMAAQPTVGQVVKLLTVLGAYNSAPQAKNAWIVEVSDASDAQKVAIEKATLSVADTVNGARDLEIAIHGAMYSDVAIAWEVTAGNDVATYADGVLSIQNPAADTTVTVKATLSIANETAEVSFNIAVAHKEAMSGEETLATFTFGANGSAEHKDGSDLGATKTYTENGYDLALTGMSKVYAPAYDATGNSCIKLGTSKLTGTLSFTVANDVDKVIINIAGYKAATSTNLTINGQSYNVTTASNNGEYTAITIDTSTTKTITLTTVTYRAMIDSIVFIGIN